MGDSPAGVEKHTGRRGNKELRRDYYSYLTLDAELKLIAELSHLSICLSVKKCTLIG